MLCNLFSLSRTSDEYDAGKCKLVEMVSLGMQRVGSEYIEWGTLACSSTGDTIALTDSERHLYLTNFKQRTPLKKRGKVNHCTIQDTKSVLLVASGMESVLF